MTIPRSATFFMLVAFYATMEYQAIGLVIEEDHGNGVEDLNGEEQRYIVPRIVGGQDASEGEYPYQISFRRNGAHFCGGSILNRESVLTAAHCVYGSRAEDIKVHAGTNSRIAVGDVYGVQKITVHPEYSIIGWANDIALLRVKGKINYNDKVQPIRIAVTDFAPVGHSAVVTGWGRLRNGGPIPVKLQEIDLQIESQIKCKQIYPNVSDANICTIAKVGEGTCYGDSGSALILDGIQVGIVSNGIPCGIGMPDVFTSVYYYHEWIQQIISS